MVPASPSGGESADDHLYCRIGLDIHQGVARARRTVPARARPAGGLRPASAGAAGRTHSGGVHGLPLAGALRLRGMVGEHEFG